MKYIIELEDEPMIANTFHQEVDKLWKAKGFNSLVFDKYGLYRLTPYTEPDRKAIEDEVWGNTWKMFLTPEDFGVTMGDSYSEAKAKYDAWKKQRGEEIHVGDEVLFKGDPHKEKAIVLRLYQPKMYKPISDVLWVDGIVEKSVLVEKLVRTGRHFDEVDELLKKMRGEQE